MVAFFLQIAKSGEPTSGLEPLTPCSLRVIHQSVQGFADPAFLGGFLCSELLEVAPYCVLGGVRVVSIEA